MTRKTPRRGMNRDGGRGAAGERRGRSAESGRGADIVRIYGFHAVRAALASPRRELVRLHATQAAVDRLAAEIAARGVPVTVGTSENIAARLPQDAVHQGVILEAKPLGPASLDEFSDESMLVILDQVTDPHNVGAILRSCAAFGVDGLVATERHSPTETGTLAKSASGALEFVPVAHVVNLARALSELEERGFMIIGFDSEAEASFADLSPRRPLALVFGAEGKGLRRLTRERCTQLARLDLPGPIKSLNVSNACVSALTLTSLRLPPKTA